MALKDITLGQYFPGNTLLHRLDPRTKLLFTVAYIVALFLAKHVLGYAVLFVLLAVLIAVSKVGIKSILRGMKPILIIVIITGLLNLFYTRGEGAPLVSFWILYHLSGGHLGGGVYGATHRHAHHLHLPADLYHLPHPAHRRPGKTDGTAENPPCAGA